MDGASTSDDDSDVIVASAAAAVTTEVKYTKNVELKSEGIFGTSPFTTYIKDDRVIRIETKVENEEEFCIDDYRDEEMMNVKRESDPEDESMSPRPPVPDPPGILPGEGVEGPGDPGDSPRTSVVSRSRSAVIKQTVSQHRSVSATSVFDDGSAVTGRIEEVVVLGTAVIHLPTSSTDSKNQT